MRKLLSVFAFAATIVFLTGPLCGPVTTPFTVSLGSVEVLKTPGENVEWDQPIDFRITNGTPEVCYLEFAIQTYLDLPIEDGGICTNPEFPFDTRFFAHTISNHDCVLETGSGFDQATGHCTANFSLECETPLCADEILPPARLGVEDDAPEFFHVIIFDPQPTTIYWEDCSGVPGVRGKAAFGSANVVFE